MSPTSSPTMLQKDLAWLRSGLDLSITGASSVGALSGVQPGAWHISHGSRSPHQHFPISHSPAGKQAMGLPELLPTLQCNAAGGQKRGAADQLQGAPGAHRHCSGEAGVEGTPPTPPCSDRPVPNPSPFSQGAARLHSPMPYPNIHFFSRGLPFGALRPTSWTPQRFVTQSPGPCCPVFARFGSAALPESVREEFCIGEEEHMKIYSS